MNKPFDLYRAICAAVDDYNERHHYSRGHLADELGFVGANAARMFSNAINPQNHDKTLNDEKKRLLLYALDDEARIVFFTEWMRQWGLKPAKMSQPECSITEFHIVVDDAQIEADESFRTSKMAMRDGTLTEDELKAIIKEATEAMQKQEEIVAMAHKRLEEMRRL